MAIKWTVQPRTCLKVGIINTLSQQSCTGSVRLGLSSSSSYFSIFIPTVHCTGSHERRACQWMFQQSPAFRKVPNDSKADIYKVLLQPVGFLYMLHDYLEASLTDFTPAGGSSTLTAAHRAVIQAWTRTESPRKETTGKKKAPPKSRTSIFSPQCKIKISRNKEILH